MTKFCTRCEQCCNKAREEIEAENEISYDVGYEKGYEQDYNKAINDCVKLAEENYFKFVENILDKYKELKAGVNYKN